MGTIIDDSLHLVKNVSVCEDGPSPPKQPDAIERLEAWLDEGGRIVRFIGKFTTSGYEVSLRDVSHDREYQANERSVGCNSGAVAKEPGLAGTIHAAIDLAEQRGL